MSGDTAEVTEGERDGRAAADDATVAPRAILGFLGGLPVGFFGLQAFGDGDAVPIIGVGAGLALVATARAAGELSPPPDLIDEAAGRGPDYERDFREAYEERLLGRRGAAAGWGGLAGTLTGFAAFLHLLSQVTT